MQIDEPTRARLRARYDSWYDSELLEITAQPEAYSPEACAAAIDELHERGVRVADALRTADEDEDDSTAGEVEAATPACDRCGAEGELERVPFVVARRGGWDWGWSLGTVTGPLRVFRRPRLFRRRMESPVLLHLALCAQCDRALRDKDGFLREGAYMLHADYLALEREGYDCILGEEVMGDWGFLDRAPGE
jgi:hypothetical protein